MRAVLEAMGERLVVCPLSEEGVFRIGDGKQWTIGPGEWRHSTPHPEGFAKVQRRGEQISSWSDGTPIYDADPIETVLRWTTDDRGGVRCVEEPAVVQHARVRLVDQAGAPLAGVLVEQDVQNSTFLTAADGWLEVEVFNGGPVRLTLSLHNLDPWLQDTLTVWPDDEVTWVLVEHGEGWSVDQQVRAAEAARWFEQEAAALALLQDPALDPALRPGVEDFLSEITTQVRIVERGFDADGRPLRTAPWP